MCLGIIAGVAGSAISAIGAIQSGRAQSASYEAQSAYAQRQAQMEQQRGAYEAGRYEDQVSRKMGEMRSQYLASGIGLSGSASDVIEDSAREASLDLQAIKYDANVRTANLMFESRLAKTNAKSARQAGTIGALSEAMNGARTLIGNPYILAGQNGAFAWR